MRARQRWLRTAIMAAVVVGLHALLASTLASRDSATALLTGGAESDGLELLLLIAFLASRLVVIVLLPGVVVYELAMTVLTWGDQPETADRAISP